MNKDKVVFRTFKDGQVIALFCDTIKDGMVESYMHIGQHSLASINIIKDTKLAKKQEYVDLKTELILIGYNPKVMKKLINKKDK